jgi:ABC-type nickel/cobalt efflux system permease component RcnA
MQNLATTNLLLGIMAAVSILEGLLIIGVGVAGWIVYRRVTGLVTDLEKRHVAPVMMRVNAILDDVKAVSTTVKEETHRVDHAIHKTMDRVDDTAQRVQATVRAKTRWVVGTLLGLRTAIEHFVHSNQKTASDSTQRGYDGL